ncbi:hypothetical protein C7271_13660 [filamentous cyanobacterium CCP5]|nr:hypothetical protein C7271_13660 [filamentous cyanobacterium CCP5]
MSSSLHPADADSSFTLLEGRYLGLRPKQGRPKWLKLKTKSGKVKVRIPKPMRSWIAAELEPDALIQVWAKAKKKTYKAVQVIPTGGAAAIAPPPVKTEPMVHTLKVCMKGSCRKRGSGDVCRALEAARDQHPEGDAIRIEKTGCLKCCKKGPNVCVLPEKKLLHQVEVEQAERILAAY